MRLIDADALEELFRETIGHIAKRPEIGKDLEHMVRASAMAVEMIQDAPTVCEWIRVKDRKPENQTPVLVYVPPYSDEDEGYIGHVGMAYYTYSARGGFWAGTDGDIYGAIGIIPEPSYWMPLPEPPKGGGGK